MSRRAQPVLVAGQLMAFVSASALFTALARDLLRGIDLAPPIAAACVLVAFVALARLAESHLGPRSATAVSLTTLFASGGLLVGCVYAIGEPIVQSGTSEPGASPGQHITVALMSIAVFMLLGTGPALLLTTRERPWMPALLRRCARVAFVVALALTAIGAERALRLPSPDRYVSSLEVFARLPAQTDFMRGHLRSEGGSCVDELPIADVRLVRSCVGSCDVSMGPCWLRLPGPDTDARALYPFSRYGELIVRIDVAHDLLVIAADHHRGVAFDLRRMRRTWIRDTDLPGSLSPPWGWIACSSVGLLAALACMIAGRRRRASDPVEALLRDDRVLTLDGRALTGVAVPPAIPAGPVVVFLSRAIGAAHYRDDAPQADARIEAGTLAEHRERSGASAMMWNALAWTSVALTSAPLLACWPRGLL